MESKINEFLNQNVNSVEILPTLYSFIFCVIASFVLKEVYLRKSTTIAAKKQIASVLPILATIIFIIIVIIKSSIALSLGLVGALSIVRFRTPIKDPEELIYLFLSIAIGIGYGSGQITITTIIYILIIIIIYFYSSNKDGGDAEYNLVVSWENNNLEFKEIIKIIKKNSKELKLVRSDLGDGQNTIVVLITAINNDQIIDILNKEFLKIDSNIKLSFFEANNNF